eukprot:1880742-Prymnesium_polylepis.1
MSSVPRFQPTTEAWPPRASAALAVVNAARDAAEPDRRRKYGFSMEMDHLHATFDSPFVRATHPVRLSQAALQSRWPAPSRSASCRTSPATSSTAQRSRTTSLVTPATGPAASTTTSN